MAGSGESSENPVHVNVVPMVDVIFCLCVFFMCCFALHRTEGRLETWMPKDLGNVGALAAAPPEIRVALYWDDTAAHVRRQFGARAADDDVELERLLAGAHADARTAGAHVPLVVDADPRVPWDEVVRVVDAGVRLGLPSVQFVGAPVGQR